MILNVPLGGNIHIFNQEQLAKKKEPLPFVVLLKHLNMNVNALSPAKDER